MGRFVFTLRPDTSRVVLFPDFINGAITVIEIRSAWPIIVLNRFLDVIWSGGAFAERYTVRWVVFWMLYDPLCRFGVLYGSFLAL